MRINISKKIRFLLIFVLSSSLCISSAFAYKEIKYPKIVEEETAVYNYTNKPDIDYTVYLKPNMLYDKAAVGEGNIYISNYVDNIQTAFSYEFIGERVSEISGDYEIIAAMEGYIARDETIKTIWKKQFSILPKSSFTTKERTFSLKKDIAIKLKDFNDFAFQVIEDSKITVDVKLTVSMNVGILSKTDKGNIIEKLSPSLVIPLNTTYFEIGKLDSEEKKGAIAVTKKVIDPKNITTSNILFYSSMVLLAILLFIIFFTRNTPASNSYIKSVLKLLKEQGNRIVAMEKQIIDAGENCYNIKSFDDLIRIADEIGKPILYSFSSAPEDIRFFYVFDELRTYVLDFKAAMNETELDNKGAKRYKSKSNLNNGKRKTVSELESTKVGDIQTKEI